MTIPRKDLPLLGGQSSIWAAEQFGTIGAPYNTRCVLSYPRDMVDGDRMESILDAIVDHHPALQARIVSDRGVPYQRFDRPAAIERRRASMADPSGDAAVLSVVDDVGTRSLDLSEEVSSLYVVDSAEMLHVVALQHHVMVDGMSRQVLMSDIDALVFGNSFDPGDDYETTLGEALDREREAASDAPQVAAQLTGVAASAVAPAGDGFAVDHQRQPDLLAGLKREGKENGFSLPGAVLAGLVKVAGGPATVPVVSMAVGTRPRASTRCIGCFVNTVPIVIRKPLSPIAASEAVREAARHRHVPDSLVGVECRRQGIAVQPGMQPLISLADLQGRGRATVHDPPGRRPGPLTVRMWAVNNDVHTTVEHGSQISDEAAGVMNVGLAAYLRGLVEPGL